MVLQVDVISDVICPWCYIGKRRLETAVAAIVGQHQVRVRWLPRYINQRKDRRSLFRLTSGQSLPPVLSPGSPSPIP
jgi:predicted DsbA family dithiol-disulfide isomerase